MKHDLGIPCVFCRVHAYSKAKLNYSVHYLCLALFLVAVPFFSRKRFDFSFKKAQCERHTLHMMIGLGNFELRIGERV